MSFCGELKRRNVFRVGVAYAAVNRPLGLPGWFETAVTVLLAVGFPVARVVLVECRLSRALQPPNTTACMMRPGMKASVPAMPIPLT
jgi:hypothetical protein